MSSHLRVELIHAVFWMGHMGVVARRDWNASRAAIYAGTWAPGLELRAEVSFGGPFDSRELTSEDVLLGRLRKAGHCDLAEWPGHETVQTATVSPAPYTTLREKLRAAELGGIPVPLAIEAFLLRAHDFNGAQYIGTPPALAALPTTTGWFHPPRHFAAAVKALSEAGYAGMRGGEARWTAKIAPHMEAELAWIDGRSWTDLHRERALKIWTSAPDDIRAAFLEEPAGFDVMVFMKLMGDLCDPGRERWLKPGETRKKFNVWSDCANVAGDLRRIDEAEGLPGRKGPYRSAGSGQARAPEPHAAATHRLEPRPH